MSTVAAKFTNVGTKFQVGTAACAIAAAAALAPVAANAAPTVEVPAAPAQVVGNFAQAPGDFTWFFQVTSVQLAASFTRTATFWTDSAIARYEAALANKPTSIFASFWQSRITALNVQRAAYGKLSFSVCRDGQGISAGPYGTVTRGAC
ncbi:hypothetical protein [Mycolicibacterium sp. CR10]|uniref:hypothetical protein n=1 Tax=Mycolicibacterium sp. CR10 TaxID=2562314 RepID=UPI0010C05BA6|nr:hypothetical protein [Mycolicibacterium sp. CR10]